MSFSFGFSGDDIEDDGDVDDQHGLADEMSKHSLLEPQASQSNGIAPKAHTLQELLQHTPSQISYNAITVTQPATTSSISSNSPALKPHTLQIQRRSLFDIRTQLMAEADLEGNDNGSENLLSGLENGDLTSGVYEGGFKTWECALDLASLCANLDFGAAGSSWDIVELGAGSAIPSLAILQGFLSTRSRNALRLTLCDYNEDVLRLATAPNVLVNYFQPSGLRNLSEGSSSQMEERNEEGEFDVEDLGPGFVGNMKTHLLSQEITCNFISGGWGDAFIDLFTSLPSPPRQPSNLLILASETIYSPASTKVFAHTLVRLLDQHRQSHSEGEAKAWIAAKKVYFGVGGGVDDFKREIQRLGGEVRTLLETIDTGVGRVILEVMAAPKVVRE